MHNSRSHPAVIACTCGKRYRLTARAAGHTLPCPHCGALLRIASRATHAAHGVDARAAPAQPPGDELLALSAGPTVARESSPAPPGGPAGVAAAAEPRPRVNPRTGVPLPPPLPSAAANAEPGALPRDFLADLFASVYLVGSRGNVVNLAATAVACTLPEILSAIPLLACFTWPLLLVLDLLIVLYIGGFFWSTLTLTAEGEDEIPHVQPEFDFWDSMLLPCLRLAVISGLCFGPAIYLYLGYSETDGNSALIGLAVLAGALAWPVATMSVALGDTVLYLRPDWLVRCAVAIGPPYLLACALVAGAAIFGRFLWVTLPEPPFPASIACDVLASAVLLYCGYVVFRTLGLLFRHFRARFPWKF